MASLVGGGTTAGVTALSIVAATTAGFARSPASAASSGAKSPGAGSGAIRNSTESRPGIVPTTSAPACAIVSLACATVVAGANITRMRERDAMKPSGRPSRSVIGGIEIWARPLATVDAGSPASSNAPTVS